MSCSFGFSTVTSQMMRRKERLRQNEEEGTQKRWRRILNRAVMARKESPDKGNLKQGKQVHIFNKYVLYVWRGVNICDVTCQNQTIVIKIRCWFVMLWNKQVTWAFILYFIYICMPTLSKVTLMGTRCNFTEPRKWHKKLNFTYLKRILKILFYF